MADTQVTIEVRHNNVIFECIFCGTFKSATKSKAYAVAVATGVIPEGNNIAMASKLVCDDCYKERIKSGLFEEPSQIVAPKDKGILLPNGKKL